MAASSRVCAVCFEPLRECICDPDETWRVVPFKTPPGDGTQDDG